jgi:3-methyladenine DNA glycosylase AlkD
MGNETRRKKNLRNGAGENQFGVTLTNLRKLSKQIGSDNELAMQLWESSNSDAMLLASMILDASNLKREMVEEMIKPVHYSALIDEFCFDVLGDVDYRLEMMRDWVESEDEYLARCGWAIAVSEITSHEPGEAMLSELLDIIERDMRDASIVKQEMMNRALCEIGIHYIDFTDRCLSIGEKLEVYKDLKVAKGCTSTYAPEWIRAGIRKRKKA